MKRRKLSCAMGAVVADVDVTLDKITLLASAPTGYRYDDPTNVRSVTVFCYHFHTSAIAAQNWQQRR